jgi:hypothetical protein
MFIETYISIHKCEPDIMFLRALDDTLQNCKHLGYNRLQVINAYIQITNSSDIIYCLYKFWKVNYKPKDYYCIEEAQSIKKYIDYLLIEKEEIPNDCKIQLELVENTIVKFVSIYNELIKKHNIMIHNFNAYEYYIKKEDDINHYIKYNGIYYIDKCKLHGYIDPEIVDFSKIEDLEYFKPDHTFRKLCILYSNDIMPEINLYGFDPNLISSLYKSLNIYNSDLTKKCIDPKLLKIAEIESEKQGVHIGNILIKLLKRK